MEKDLEDAIRNAIKSCAESAGDKRSPCSTRLEAAKAAKKLAYALSSLKELDR